MEKMKEKIKVGGRFMEGRQGDGFAKVPPLIELKAKMLCEGVNVDEEAKVLFQSQNPSNAKRGGLSSGGKMKLAGKLVVNAPFYEKREADLKIISDPSRERGVLIQQGGETLCEAEVLSAPSWYSKKVGEFAITQILTAHNFQLATAVYEDCALFQRDEQCQFCVMNRSLSQKAPELVRKSTQLVLSALEEIPLKEYGGLTINGGMTLAPGRGMEIIAPVAKAVRQAYSDLPIAVEITPPSDLDWINRLYEAGVSSLMMNLEMWDLEVRAKLIPGKNRYCPREMYVAAFERAVEVLGPGRVSTCFVVGTEPINSLEEGITEVIRLGVVPSPLAGRYFEDIPDYPFVPNVDWRDFLKIIKFAREESSRQGLRSLDKAGCVACRMCDLIKDFIG